MLVRQRSVDDDVGYLVVTPLRTATATVLVVRGFISSGGRTAGRHRTGAAQRNTHVVGRVSRPRPRRTRRPSYRPARSTRSTPASRPADSARRSTTATPNCPRANPERPGWSPYRRRTCPTRPAARSNRSTSPTSSSGTCSPRSPWPRRSSWPVPSAGGSADRAGRRGAPDHAGGRQRGPARRPLRTPRALTDGRRPGLPLLARSQLLDRVPPGLRVAALAGAVHLGEPHDAVDIDQERAAVGEAGVSLNTPYACATAPCGQKSASSGNS